MSVGDDLGEDDEGVSLPDLDAVQKEALRVLADMARDLVEFPVSVAVEVRDNAGPVMDAREVFDIHRTTYACRPDGRLLFRRTWPQLRPRGDVAR